MTVILLGVSLLLQLAAAGLALRLVRIAGLMTASLLIAFAFVLMSMRQAFVLYGIATGNVAQPVNLPAEFVAFLVSVLMLFSILLIGPFLVSRGHAERTLRESEARYHDILENMTDLYFRTNADSRLSMISRSVSESLGYSS